MKVLADCLSRTLNDPRHDSRGCLRHEKIGIVLHIAAALDSGIEGDHDQTPPRPRIIGTHPRQVVGIKHKGVARRKGKRILIFLFRKNLIRGTHLLNHGGIQAHPFFQLGGDNQPFSLRLGKLRLHIPLTAHGQRVGRHISAVGSKHTGNGIPEGRLSVPSFPIGDDQRFQIDSAHSRHAHDLLHIFNQGFIPAKNRIQCVQPQTFPFVAGTCHRNLRNVVLRAVVAPA